jgi:uncharacterized protein YggE
MKRFTLLAAMAMPAATALATSASAAEIQIAVSNPVIELGVTEVVQSDPDVAQISAGVMTRAPTASEAMRQNAQQMDAMVKRLQALGIKREDIQTSNFNLNPQYNYNRQDGSAPEFIGYDVNNSVTVKLRKLDRIGDVLDELVQAGANNIYGPNFMLEDDIEPKAVARRNAFAKARVQAEEYARLAGYSGVRILEIAENVTTYGPVPPPPMAIRVTAASADSASTPVEIGQVGTAATITVKYEMTR